MFKPKYVKKILLTNKQVVEGIKKAGKWATKKFKGCKQPPVAVCLLKGACQFFAHLVENIDIDLEYDFTTMKSYVGTKSTSKPKIIKNLSIDIKNRDVIIIEDVADTAHTLTTLISNIKKNKPKSITTIVLIDKADCRKIKFKPDYACFTILHNPFIVGYGLDCNEIGRNLSYIAEFDKRYCK